MDNFLFHIYNNLLTGDQSAGEVEHVRVASARDAGDATKTAKRTKSVVIPTRPGGTRWVQHMNRALVNISRSYHTIALHLTQVSKFCLN